MRFYEITGEYDISINVKSGDNKGNFVTSPAFYDIESDSLFVEPFMHDRYIISFEGDLKIDMTAYIPGELPYYWKSVHVMKAERGEKIYHVISSPVEGVRINRRSAERLPVGVRGKVQLAKGGLDHVVEIHNISATGVCFIAKEGETPEFKKESRVHVTYTDPDTGFNADLLCRIVRVNRYGTHMVYGCAFTRVYMDVARYIANKRIRNK